MITIDEFMAAFFPDEHEPIRLRFFKPHGSEPVKYGTSRAAMHGNEEVKAYIRQMNLTHGVYFVVNAGGDKDAEIIRFNAWFAEDDERSIEAQHQRLDSCPIAPSIRVQTKKSVHSYWLIEGECDVTAWRDMQTRLIAYFGGDERIKNPSRVMRVPYLNHISDSESGEIIRHKITLPRFGLERFSLAQMRAAFAAPERSQVDIRYSAGTYPTWDALNAEARRRILSQPGCATHGEWAKCKGICHDGKSDTGLAVNVATGAYFCQADCDTAHVLRALGLPERPDNEIRKPKIEAPQKASESKPVGIYSVYDLNDKIDALYEQGLTPGESPGWDSLEKLYTVKRGQFTVLTGVPGSGKSQVLDNIMLNLATAAGWRFAVCSLENQPLEQHMATLMEILTGEPFSEGPRPRMSRDTRDKAKAWLHERFKFLLPPEENCTIDGLLELADKVRLTHGLDGLVIDPWNEFEHRRPAMMTETQYTSDVLSRIRRFGRAYGHHSWLVAHPTKLLRDKDGKYPVPTLYDISGSSHFRNKCDMGLVAYRDLNDVSNPTVVYVQKVRYRWCGKLGSVELSFDPVTGRYTDKPNVYAAPGYRNHYEPKGANDDDELYA